MLFNSTEFIFVFLPVTLLLFFSSNLIGLRKISIILITAASLFFYSWWNPNYLFLILGSIGFNFFLGNHISNIQPSKKIRIKQTYLIGGIIINIALLGYFKYANFFIESLNALLGLDLHNPEILLPLAISFFTFQQISYLVDAYRGETKEYSFLDYCLFVTFFPQLIAGPIVHHKEMMHQFRNKKIYQFNIEDFTVGVTIFCAGLYKKIVIADNMAPIANTMFTSSLGGDSLTLCQAWIGALAYSFQLYFDFSGYSEMALGIARMFGIVLPLNFNSPYKATDISDFWRRWHITLSNFLRDYLYIPLGGNRHGQVRQISNLMITMLLGGLWHGAGWTFVLWGGIHGFYLSINHVWRKLTKHLFDKSTKEGNWISKLPAQLLTFGLVVFSWVIFRAETVSSAVNIWKSMLGLNGFQVSLSEVYPQTLIQIVGLCLWVLILPNISQLMQNYKPTITELSEKADNTWKALNWRPNFIFGLSLSGLLFLTVKCALRAPSSEFLYFNF